MSFLPQEINIKLISILLLSLLLHSKTKKEILYYADRLHQSIR